jgi:hypothetical protein
MTPYGVGDFVSPSQQVVGKPAERDGDFAHKASLCAECAEGTSKLATAEDALAACFSAASRYPGH